MTRGIRTPDTKKGSLKDVYVARTVQRTEKGFDRFLTRLGRHLGPMAAINTIGSTHLTFLESAGIRPRFQENGYTPADIRSFKGSLHKYLTDTLPVNDHRVEIDRDTPLVWKGWFKLALNVIPDERLLAEREEIESFLRLRFGDVPRLRSFDPHITLGAVMPRFFTPEARDNPESILPEGLVAPRSVVLNGLMTYLGRIQPKECVSYE